VKRAATALVALALAGCASTSPERAFREIATLVKARTGRTLSWNQGGSGDVAVGRALRVLLANPLTVDGAVQVALLSNQDLQATYEGLRVAQADLVQAGLLENPVFGASVLFPVAGAAQQGFSLSIADDFLGLFTLAARKTVASTELEAAEAHVAGAVLRLAFDVESAFFRLQAAEQELAMRRTILESGDAALDIARRQHTAGNMNDLDLANQEALYEQVRTDVVRSEADVVTAHEELARLMGVWGAAARYRVVDKLPELPATEPPLEHLEALAIDRRLDLREAHAEAQARSHALAMTKNYRWLGSAGLGATYEQSPEGFTVVGPEASVELPIFDQKQAAVARLEGQVRAALSHEIALAIDIRSEVREARERLLAARRVVERYAQVIVPLRERVVTLSQQQYDAMLMGIYQLLVAKQSEVNAYREFIEALRDYWMARAELERAIGGVLPTPTPEAKR
jgi:cobalt-zinc-cadmium efflux system outer membrane protein